MEIKKISDKKNEMEFELVGGDHSISNLIVSKLLKNKDVELAEYNIPHPQVGNPLFYIKTKKSSPKTALKKSLDGIKKDLGSLSRSK